MTKTPENSLTIWVDADACPRELRDLLELTALRRHIRTVFVANSYMRVHESPYIAFVQVDSGPDVADDYMVEHASGGDIAVTGDIPLAARLVEKEVLVVNTRGEEISRDNIGERLAMRDLLDGLRGAGMVSGGPKELGGGDVQRFANSLDRIVTKRLKK